MWNERWPAGHLSTVVPARLPARKLSHRNSETAGQPIIEPGKHGPANEAVNKRPDKTDKTACRRYTVSPIQAPDHRRFPGYAVEGNDPPGQKEQTEAPNDPAGQCEDGANSIRSISNDRYASEGMGAPARKFTLKSNPAITTRDATFRRKTSWERLISMMHLQPFRSGAVAVLVAFALLVPEAMAQFARAPKLPDTVELEADIPYASTDNPRQRLNILLPKNPKNKDKGEEGF